MSARPVRESPSEKPPLVLLHGLASSGNAWQEVAPLVAEHHDVYAPTYPGHRGGPVAAARPLTFRALVEFTRDFLDEQRLERAHVTGHSMGGAIAIEMARLGRAQTVCAISPGGFWTPARSQSDVFGSIEQDMARARRLRPVIPLLLRSTALRRRFMRGATNRAEQVTYRRAVEVYLDIVDSAAAEIATRPDEIAPLDPLPCPVTVLWGADDVTLPVADFGDTARQRLPGATFHVVPGLGHEAMLDDPALVARTILATTGAQV